MREGPRRILFVDSCIGMAGGQFSLLEILRTLDPSRFTALVASPGGSGLRERCDRLGVPWFEIPFRSAHLSCGAGTAATAPLKDAWRATAGVRVLAELIRQERIDLVHANNFKAALVASFAALFAKRPLVFHDRILLRHWPLGGLVTRLSSRVIAISESVRAKHRGAALKKVVVIPPGVDMGWFVPGTGEQPSQRVCFIGRLTREKGIESLIEAAALVAERVPTARFVIAGAPFTIDDEIYLEGIKLMTAEIGLTDRVEFPGYVDDVKSLLVGCDMLAVPSRREGLGRVVLEAMAMGKPVVAFATGGLTEIITDGENGLLAAPGDSNALAQAMIRLLGDRDLAGRLGGNGRKTVASEYSSDLVAEKTMALYDEILKRRP